MPMQQAPGRPQRPQRPQQPTRPAPQQKTAPSQSKDQPKKQPISRRKRLIRQLRASMQQERKLWIICIAMALALIAVIVGVVLIAKSAAAARQKPEEHWPTQSELMPDIPSEEPSQEEPSEPPVIPKNITVCIDPGHGFMKSTGNYDCGSSASAYFAATGEYEDGFTLRMALALQKELLARGYTVVMTRTEASERVVDVEERDDLINALGADLCISIHGNEAGESTVTGSWIMVQKGRENSLPLAEAVTAAVNSAELSEPAAVLREDNTGIVVLCALDCPSILIEAAFLDSSADAEKAASPAWQNAYAAAVADGIDAFTSEK